jgi:hypothetical protein
MIKMMHKSPSFIAGLENTTLPDLDIVAFLTIILSQES